MRATRATRDARATRFSNGVVLSRVSLALCLSLSLILSHSLCPRRYKQTYADVDGQVCASRELMLSLGEWSTHFFTSDITPQGDVTVAQWVAFWSELHANISDPGFAWDAWMSHAMTYYVPELTPFVAKWSENGTPFLARKYVNPLDGETLFSAFVAVPHTGVMVEMISATLEDAEMGDHFQELEPASCPAAVRVNRTLAEMNSAWASMAGRMANEKGLPDALIVQLSMPTAADPSDSRQEEAQGREEGGG